MNSKQDTLGHDSEPTSEETHDPAGIDFLDFLFTVAISVGLTPEVIGQKGLLSETWHKFGTWPNCAEWFDIGVFLLGFFNLTLSWFGYHASLASKPLKYTTKFGLVRFNMDVILVVLYGIMLIEFRRFNVVMWILLAVHFIFVLWDYLKIREHPGKFPGKGYWRYRREWVSLFAFVFVGLVCIWHFTTQINEWIILLLSGFITIFYRINKYHATWERLLGYRGNANANA